jgi:hypothetical protein
MLRFAPGDVVDVCEDVRPSASASTGGAGAVSSFEKTEQQPSTQSASSFKPKIGVLKKSQKKGAASMADVIKRKQSLIKITRQKVPVNRIVNLAPSTARILMR